MYNISADEPRSDMPIVVGAFDAKTHLASLLDQVQQGQTITITRHGVPVARLAPIDLSKRRLDRDTLLAAFDAFRSQHSLPPGTPARDLIDEGRKW